MRSTECITGRHLLTKILWATLEALGRKAEWEGFGKGRCEHVSALAVLLGSLLDGSARRGEEDQGEGQGEGQGEKDRFVLVLDGVDRQREAPGTLLPALARLGDMVSSILFVLWGSLGRIHWKGIVAKEVDTLVMCGVGA